ncbi:MAG: hypothetical protein U5L45_13445 [Saprospiraceae bacterium]|nr:hypothetical protein [Saprospiraceae bacterium]
MTKTLFRFVFVVASLTIGIYLFNKPKQSSSLPNTNGYDKWIDGMKFEKPNAVYKQLMEKVLEGMKTDPCESLSADYFTDAAKLYDFFLDFKVLPFDNKYLLAKNGGMNGKGTNIFAIFDNAHKILGFKYDSCGLGSGDNFKDIRLVDWNKDGHLEFLISKTPTYSADGHFLTTQVYDIYSFDNKIIKIFEYEESNTLNLGSDLGLPSISTNTEVKIDFENPNYFKLTKKIWTSSADIEANDPKYEKVQDYLNEVGRDTATMTTYYKQDSQTKIYK